MSLPMRGKFGDAWDTAKPVWLQPLPRNRLKVLHTTPLRHQSNARSCFYPRERLYCGTQRNAIRLSRRDSPDTERIVHECCQLSVIIWETFSVSLTRPVTC